MQALFSTCFSIRFRSWLFYVFGTIDFPSFPLSMTFMKFIISYNRVCLYFFSVYNIFKYLSYASLVVVNLLSWFFSFFFFFFSFLSFYSRSWGHEFDSSACSFSNWSYFTRYHHLAFTYFSNFEFNIWGGGILLSCFFMFLASLCCELHICQFEASQELWKCGKQLHIALEAGEVVWEFWWNADVCQVLLVWCQMASGFICPVFLCGRNDLYIGESGVLKPPTVTVLEPIFGIRSVNEIWYLRIWCFYV